MKKILFIAGLAIFLSSCGGGSNDKAMTPEEENAFAEEEIQAIDSSVNNVVDSIDVKEAEVNELLEGI